MISARRGPMPGTASRWGSDIFASLAASLRTARVAPCRRECAERCSADLDARRLGRSCRFSCRGFAVPAAAAQASESAAAVPEVAMTSGDAARLNSAMGAAQFARDQLPHARQAFGRAPGSALRNCSVRRTAPSGRLTVSLMRLCSESVISQLPPPRSSSSTRPPAPGSEP